MALRIMFVDMQISIHTPHAGSDKGHIGIYIGNGISIHTPHAGSDFMKQWLGEKHKEFQSTLPMRGATPRQGRCSRCQKFQSTLPMRGATPTLSSF